MLRGVNGGGGASSSFRPACQGLLTLILTALLFGWAFGGRLVTLGGYYYSLRGGSNVVLLCGELIRPPI